MRTLSGGGLRKSSGSRVVRQIQANTTSLPAPVGGWNDRDSIADMKPTDAVIMKNFWPQTDSVGVRDGWVDHATGLPGLIESLMVYNAANGTQEMYAASGTAFYDVSLTGAVGAAVVTGQTNARWNYVNMTDSNPTSYLCAFNGVDSPQFYNGSSWITITGVSSPAIIGGITPSSLKNPWIHKRRLWAVEADTLSAWYSPVDAVGGTYVEFPLYALFKKGGSLLAGGTWTVDGGDGLDDYMVFVTTEGEVAIYQGTNPASDFTIVGVWDIGEPIGERCLMKLAGELMIITMSGVYPVSNALRSSQTNPKTAITDRIRSVMSSSAVSYSGNFGWQLQHYPQGDMLLLNVPIVEGSEIEQYAMNTITGAWCRFTDIDSVCWAVYNKQLYFGGSTRVGLFGTTKSDNGSNINGDLLPAFSFFGSRGRVKHFKMVKPYIRTNGVPSVLAALNVNFNTDSPTAPLNFTAPNVFTWDVSNWDEVVWSEGAGINQEFETVTAIGTSASLRLVTASAGLDVELLATDFVYELGGIV